MRATGLRCEYRCRPLGIDVKKPRFGWRLEADRPNAVQTGYELEVAKWDEGFDRSGIVWRTGRVASSTSTWVAYEGRLLQPVTRYTWRVRVWGRGPTPGPWAKLSWFETGRLGQPWVGSWITAATSRTDDAQPVMRRGFRLRAKPTWARVYVTALGLYECRLNGTKVGDSELRPGWTDYAKRVVYDTYDVTELLQEGENALGVMLAPGWYSGRVAWFGRELYGNSPSLRLELRARFVDGDELIVSSDEHWRWTPGPIREADLLDGERYDAMWSAIGWDKPSFQDSDWKTVEVAAVVPTMEVVAPTGPPVKAMKRIRATALPPRDQSVHRYDLGQNIAGRVRIRVRGPRGATIRLRHAEMLQDDGLLYTENLRSAAATDIYTLYGEGEETYEPRFTFHGFRYVEVELSDADNIDVLDVEGLVLHNDLPTTGAFECSNPLINQLFSNQQWGQKGNYLEVPTDCPQRDERLGWTGDAQVFAPTSCFNMDVSGFFAKWMQDLRDAQGTDGRYPKYAPDPKHEGLDGGPGWADAGVICAWQVWLHYADRHLLASHYDSMRRFAEFLDQTSEGGVRPVEREGVRMGYGDWLAPDGGPERTGATPRELIGTAYHIRALDLMAKIAAILDLLGHATAYRERSCALRRAFTREFLDEDARLQGETQTAYLLALAFDVLPEEQRARAFGHLVRRLADEDYHLATGFLGTPLLCPVLSRFGRADLAYRVLLQRTYPGWLYSVLQGATTMWERWDSYTKDKGFGPADMNSFNHYAYGAIGQWLYETVLGIAPCESEPGFKRFIAKPVPGGGLEYARGHVDTVHGRIQAKWEIDGGRLVHELTVPPNTLAELTMPFTTPLEGRRKPPLPDDTGTTRVILGSGNHLHVQALPASI